MQSIFTGRFKIVKSLFIIFLVLSFITRIILMFKSAGQISWNILELLKSFSVGMFFDVVACSYFMVPFIFFTIIIPPVIAKSKVYKGLVWFFYSLTVFIWVFNVIAEYFFWDEFEVRFNFIAVDYLIYTTEVIGNIVESYSLPLLLTIVAAVSALIIRRTVKKSIVNDALNDSQSFGSRLKTGGILLVPAIFSFFFVTHSWAEISTNAYNKELAKNGIYSLFEAFKNNQLDYDHFYTTVDDKIAFKTLQDLMSDSLIVYDEPGKVNPLYSVKRVGEEKRYNVMFVTVESLSGEFMKYIGGEDGYDMPFLDSLTHEGIFLTNLYANGTRTVRGLEALNLCIPPTPGTSLVRRPGNDHLYSLGEIFKQKGYQNKFIYGGFGYFDNMNTFFSGNGYEIVDRSVFADNEITFANVWGTCDGDSYRRAMKEADKSFAEGKPFLNFIMTTSNHKPYTFPEIGIKLPPNRTGGVRYTDYALEQFIKAAKLKPWFDSTIFVIVADHCGSSAGKSEIPVLKYQIPCVIYAPKIVQPQMIDKLCSQVDIPPTLMAMMNWSYKSTFYGKDIFTMKKEEERAFVGTYQKLGYIQDNKLVVLSPQKKITQYKFDRFTGDMKPTSVEPDMQNKVVSLYQTAEHMFIQKLNKVKH
ncbi:MAG TPA: sulfatase-like hydrolase/transferase [Bacteroidia bacterium]|nr:sulfatase-like hydrolase/transferase [Bacteroidia bacterium]